MQQQVPEFEPYQPPAQQVNDVADPVSEEVVAEPVLDEVQEQEHVEEDNGVTIE